MVKAKFKCNCVSVDEQNEGNKFVTLDAVMDGSEENKSFAKYTPSGNVQINISRETPAYDFFEAGKEYYLTFEETTEK